QYPPLFRLGIKNKGNSDCILDLKRMIIQKKPREGCQMSQFVHYEYGAAVAFLVGAVWLIVEFFKKD
ncbi:MAG: hypothetical protein ACYSOR_08155, partial [Planctomycetota bacterium]